MDQNISNRKFFYELYSSSIQDIDIAISFSREVEKWSNLERQIVKLYTQKFPQQEIASILNLPQQRISDILNQSKKKLLKILVKCLRK